MRVDTHFSRLDSWGENGKPFFNFSRGFFFFRFSSWCRKPRCPFFLLRPMPNFRQAVLMRAKHQAYLMRGLSGLGPGWGDNTCWCRICTVSKVFLFFPKAWIHRNIEVQDIEMSNWRYVSYPTRVARYPLTYIPSELYQVCWWLNEVQDGVSKVFCFVFFKASIDKIETLNVLMCRVGDTWYRKKANRSPSPGIWSIPMFDTRLLLELDETQDGTHSPWDQWPCLCLGQQGKSVNTYLVYTPSDASIEIYRRDCFFQVTIIVLCRPPLRHVLEKIPSENRPRGCCYLAYYYGIPGTRYVLSKSGGRICFFFVRRCRRIEIRYRSMYVVHLYFLSLTLCTWHL